MRRYLAFFATPQESSKLTLKAKVSGTSVQAILQFETRGESCRLGVAKALLRFQYYSSPLLLSMCYIRQYSRAIRELGGRCFPDFGQEASTSYPTQEMD